MASTHETMIKLWYFLLWLRFQIFQKRRLQRPVIEHVKGRPLLVLPGVFNPTLFFSSEFFAEYLLSAEIPSSSSVLDLGTGSGVVAIVVAPRVSGVVATDVNAGAVRCARINAILNRVEDRVQVREGDLFAPVAGEQFDLVLFNPPYFAGEPRDVPDRAFRSPDMAGRFARELKNFLKPEGSALLLLSTRGQMELFLRELSGNSLAWESVSEKRRIGETLRIYLVSPR